MYLLDLNEKKIFITYFDEKWLYKIDSIKRGIFNFVPLGTATYLVEHIVSGQSIHVVLLLSGSPSQRWDSGR